MADDKNNPRRRGRTSGNRALMLAGLVLVGVAGAVGTLLLVNDGSLFGKGSSTVQAGSNDDDDEDHEGQVAVYISARPIEAYAAVQTEDLLNAQSKQLAVKWIEKDKAAQAGFMTDLNAIRGRVMGRDKGTGFAFTEADFLPKGTRPGPSAALEAGMRGVWVEPDQVQGLDSLRRGDRIDLVAMVKVKETRTAANDPRFVSPGAAASLADENAWKTSKRQLVKNGKVVVPLPTDATKRKGRKVFVQVAEGEVDELSNALGVGAEIVCYLRSGQPGSGDTDLPAPERPPAMDTIEVMQGGKTTTVAVPATKPN